MTSNAKIRPEHLACPAIVYVRQSTLGEVRHHEESRRRQYALADHARRLGWREVVTIDEDQGKSGASAADRTGFQRLVSEVSLGRVGAVVGLEVSRPQLRLHSSTAKRWARESARPPRRAGR
jgi:DNA invertase Pin-like site-specific DNA recombinase